MSNNIELINFNGNTKGLETSLKRLEKLFNTTNDSVKEITSSTLKFNKQGGDVGATLRGTLKDGRTFTTTLARMTDASGKLTKSWKIVGTSAKRLKKDIKSLTDNTSIADSKLFKKVDAPKIFGDTSKFDNKTIAGIKSSEDAIEKLIAKGAFTRKQFKKVASEIGQDFSKTFSGAEADAAKAFRKIFNQIESAEKKLSQSTAKDGKRTQKDFNLDADTFARKDLGGLTNNLIGLGPEQVAKVEKASATIDRLLRNNVVSRKRLLEINKKLKSNFRESFTGDDQKAAIAIRNLNQAMLKAGDTGESSASKILTSWKLVSRVFVVQNLHLILNQIVFSFKEMVQASNELDVKIAEISTIAGKAEFSFDAWKDSIRGVSNEFGLNTADTAAAAYQALSNQVAEGTRVFGFLNQAATFARVTNSSLEDSTNLLSSALNVYGKEGLTAERASAILFKTIELGRVRAGELANDFGSMAILGGQLGITIEELTGSFSSLTIQGVNSSKAITLMRAVMLKLVRPTDAMKNLIKSWGVVNAEAAIQTFGFQGVLEKLNQVALKGGVDALGEVAGRLRTTIGLAGLTGRSFDNVTASIKEIEETSVESFEKAKKSIKDAVGVRAQQQVQKFFNTFESNVGLPLIEVFVEQMEELGGLDTVTERVIENTTDLFKILKTPIDVVGSLGSVVSAIRDLGSLASPIISLTNIDFSNLTKLFGNFSVVAPVLSTVIFRFGALKAAGLVLGSRIVGLLTTTTSLGRAFKILSLSAGNGRVKLLSLSKAADITKLSLKSLRVSAAGALTGITLGITLALEASYAYQRSLEKVSATLEEVSKKNVQAFNKLSIDVVTEQTLAINEQDKLIGQKYLKTLAGLNIELNSVLKTYKDIQSSDFNLDIDTLNDQLFGAKKTDAKDTAIKFLFKDIKAIQSEVLDFEKSIDTSKFSFDDLLGKPDLNSIKESVKLYKEVFGNSNLIEENKDALLKFNLTTGSTTEQLSKLYNRFIAFESKARGDQRLGLIESAKEGFKEADNVLDSFLSKVTKLKDQLKSALEDVTSRLKAINLDSLNSKQLKGQLKFQENKGLGFLKSGDLDSALKAFKESDKILSQLNSKGKNLTKTFGFEIGKNLEKSLLQARQRALQAFKIPEIDKAQVLQDRVDNPQGNTKQVVANKILQTSLRLQQSEANVALKIKEQIDLQNKLLDVQKQRAALISRGRETSIDASNNQQAAIESLNELFGTLRKVGDDLNGRFLLEQRSGGVGTTTLPFLDKLNDKFKTIQDSIAEVRSNTELSDSEKKSIINSYFDQLARLANSKLLEGVLGKEVLKGRTLNSSEASILRSEQRIPSLNDLDDKFGNNIVGNPLDLLKGIQDQGKALEQATKNLLEAQNSINRLENTQPVFESRLEALLRTIENNGAIAPRQTIQRAQTVDQSVDVGGISFEINNTTNTPINFNQMYSQIAQRLQRDVKKGTIKL